jgi:hypothetical protein
MTWDARIRQHSANKIEQFEKDARREQPKSI